MNSEKITKVQTIPPMNTFIHNTVTIAKHDSIDFNLYWESYVNKQNYHMLDVGCSSGNFLSNDPKNIVGIDNSLSNLSIAKNRGYEVILGDVNNLPFKKNSFDAINLWAIIEHLHEPMFLLKECVRVLKPKKIIKIHTPDWEKGYKVFYKDPTHKFPFTKYSLKWYAEEAGINTLKIERHCVPTGMGFLIRKGILTMRAGLFLTRFFFKFGVFHNPHKSIVLTGQNKA